MDTGLLSALIGLVGLVFALALFLWIRSKPTGSDLMKEISDVIHDGAMVFLKREYSILAIFIVVVFALLSWRIAPNTGFAFLGGAACSMLAGFFGMKVILQGNTRRPMSFYIMSIILVAVEKLHFPLSLVLNHRF